MIYIHIDPITDMQVKKAADCVFQMTEGWRGMPQTDIDLFHNIDGWSKLYEKDNN